MSVVLFESGIIGHKYTFIACFLATGEFVTIYNYMVWEMTWVLLH